MKKVLVIITSILLLAGCGSKASSSQVQSESAVAESTSIAVSSAAVASSSVSETTVPAAAPQTTDGAFAVTVLEHEIMEDYEGKPVLAVKYSFTNNSEKTTSFLLAISTQAFQNGVQLSTGILVNDKFDPAGAMKDIKPGTTIEVQAAYVLDDNTSPVELEVSELFTFTDELIVAQTIDIAE